MNLIESSEIDVQIMYLCRALEIVQFIAARHMCYSNIVQWLIVNSSSGHVNFNFEFQCISTYVSIRISGFICKQDRYLHIE